MSPGTDPRHAPVCSCPSHVYAQSNASTPPSLFPAFAAMLPFRRTMPHTYDPGPSTAITLPGPATLGPNRPLLRSRFWSLPGGGGCAPLPPGGRRLLAADRGQLVGRLWACRLGKWTPGEEAALREAVRLAAIKVLYTHELQVGSGAL